MFRRRLIIIIIIYCILTCVSENQCMSTTTYTRLPHPSIHPYIIIISYPNICYFFGLTILSNQCYLSLKCMHFHPPTENIMCGEWWCNSLNGNQSTKYGLFTVVHKCCKCLFTYLIYYDMLVFICQTHYCHLCFCSTLCKILTKHVDMYTHVLKHFFVVVVAVVAGSQHPQRFVFCVQ